MKPIDPDAALTAGKTRCEPSDGRRRYPRLRLSYGVRVDHPGQGRQGNLAHTVTQNISARGTYFCTPRIEPFAVGAPVHIQISVPHRIATDGRERSLDLHGSGRVVRLEGPGQHGLNGEDGVPKTGVAIEFDCPLEIDLDWL